MTGSSFCCESTCKKLWQLFIKSAKKPPETCDSLPNFCVTKPETTQVKAAAFVKKDAQTVRFTKFILAEIFYFCRDTSIS